MKQVKNILAWFSTVLALSCTGMEKDVPVVNPVHTNGTGVINASCSVSGQGLKDSGTGIQAKSIFGQTTIGSLDANFIKVDEPVPADWTDESTREDYVLEEFPGWGEEELYNAGYDQPKILDASILSSPDNTAGIHFRSIYFNPQQTYTYRSYDDPENPTPENKDDDIIVGFVSRMVGWYPKTYELKTGDDGKPADTEFSESPYEIIDGKTCVLFENRLDGQTDVMMTDMRMGRYDLRDNGFRNNAKDIDIQPYGHMFSNDFDASEGYDYCNYFTFNHYLTGVRLYVQASGSDLSLISWDQITDVVFLNQPTEVVIALPVEQARGTENHANPDGTVQKPIIEGTVPTLPIENVSPIFGE